MIPIDVRETTTLLEVFDMPTSIAFYRDLLGFEIIQSWGPQDRLDWAMLKLGGATIMLNAAYENDERPPTADLARAKGHADAELYFACGNVDEVYAYLRQQGRQVTQPHVTFYGMKQVWLDDPDSFKICFQSPVKSS